MKIPAAELPGYEKTLAEVYGEGRLFHGEQFQGIVRIDGCSENQIIVTAKTASSPKYWSTSPLRSKWCADPLALDCVFQALILWSHQECGKASLPVRFELYEQFVPAYPKGEVRIHARIEKHSEHNAIVTVLRAFVIPDCFAVDPPLPHIKQCDRKNDATDEQPNQELIINAIPLHAGVQSIELI